MDEQDFDIDFSVIRGDSDFDEGTLVTEEQAAEGARKLKDRIPYLKRNRRIRRLRLAQNYSDYLQSETWKNQRKRVLARDRWRCQCCGGVATQVHHIKYTKATLRVDATYWLISICRPCHEFIEFGEDREKLSLRASKKRIFVLRRRNGLTKSTSKLLNEFGKPKARSK